MKPLLIILLLLSLKCYSQTASLSGTVIDSALRKPIAFATVTIRSGGDIINYKLSNADGVFRVPQLPVGNNLVVTVTHVGYQSVTRHTTLNGTQNNELGYIAMLAGTELKEVIISGMRPPVIVKKDTIEFNADAFKTMPNALVEDLFRKLPGFRIEKNGVLTVNGKPVDRLLVNSREFFGSNPGMAMKNLDAAIVDKVQVINQTDDIFYNPSGISGSKKQAVTINLALKPWAKRGVVGKAGVGFGTRKTHDAILIGNVFRDTLQVNILGFTNNRSRGAFNYEELSGLGGFNRSGGRAIMGTGNNATQINDISFGGLDDGINNERGGGINLNHVTKSGLQSNIQYFYGHKNNLTAKSEYTTQNFDSTFLNKTASSTDTQIGDAQSASIMLLTPIGSKKNVGIKIRPLFNYATVVSDMSQAYLVSGVNNTASSINNTAHDFLSNTTFNNEVQLNARLAGGKSFVFNNITEVNTALSRGNGYSSEVVGSYPSAGNTSLLSDVETTKSNTQVSFNKPTKKGGYGISILHNLETNNYELATGNSLRSSALIRGVTERNVNSLLVMPVFSTQYAQPGSIYLVPGATFYTSTTRLSNSSANYKQLYFTPMLQWNPFGQFQISYHRTVQAPSISQMQGTLNIYAPLLSITGNIHLRPTVTDQVGYDYSKYLEKQTLNFASIFLYRIKHDDIIWNQQLDALGVQTLIPVNTHKSHNLFFMLRLAKDVKIDKNWSLVINPSFNYSSSNSAIIFNGLRTAYKQFDTNLALDATLQYQNIVEMTLGYDNSQNRVRYANVFNTLQTHQHNVNGSIKVNLNERIMIRSNIRYERYLQETSGFRDNRAIWDSAVDYFFLKGRTAMFSLSARDLLNQGRNLTQVIQPGTTTTSRINTLPRYFFISFTYNLKGFAKAPKSSARFNLF